MHAVGKRLVHRTALCQTVLARMSFTAGTRRWHDEPAHPQADQTSATITPFHLFGDISVFLDRIDGISSCESVCIGKS